MLTVGALFMVAAGMYSTGAITMITEKLIGLPKTLLGAQLKILPSVSIGSAFLNNTPLVAMMIPVIRDLSKSCRLAASRLYIPLSYASILGGTCTLIGTSTNLVISGMVIDAMTEAGPNTPYMREIGMFDLAWIGVPATLIGLGFIMLFSKWLLPESKETLDIDEMIRRFGAEFAIPSESPLIGKTLESLGFVNPVGFQLLMVQRWDGREAEKKPGLKLQEGDVLTSPVISVHCQAYGLPMAWCRILTDIRWKVSVTSAAWWKWWCHGEIRLSAERSLSCQYATILSKRVLLPFLAAGDQSTGLI